MIIRTQIHIYNYEVFVQLHIHNIHFMNKIKLIYINDILSSHLTVAILNYSTGLSPNIIVFHR